MVSGYIGGGCRETVGQALSEAQWLDRVVDTAKLHGWSVAHFRPARTERGWRTPMQGHAGFPDLVLARDGVVILAELKTNTGRPTVEQKAWLTQLGGHSRLWRPKNWPEVLRELKGPR